MARLNYEANRQKTKVPMPELDPAERAQTFEEVALGYSEEEAVVEAAPLHPVPRRAVRGRLPGGRAHPAASWSRWPLGRLRRAPTPSGEERERAAGHLRARVPAGDAVRRAVCTRGKQRRAGGHRPAWSASCPTGPSRSRCRRRQGTPEIGPAELRPLPATMVAAWWRTVRRRCWRSRTCWPRLSPPRKPTQSRGCLSDPVDLAG